MMSTHQVTQHTLTKKKCINRSSLSVCHGTIATLAHHTSATHNIITCECTFICTAVFYGYCSHCWHFQCEATHKNYYRNRFVFGTTMNKKIIVFRSMCQRVSIILYTTYLGHIRTINRFWAISASLNPW